MSTPVLPDRARVVVIGGGVIGTSVATRRIKTGDRLRVDGGAGRVEILAGEPAASAAGG